MPIIDCAYLLQAKKQMEPKLHAEAFVNHVLPKVAEMDLQDKMLALIKKGRTVEVPIFTYHTTRLLADPNSIAEGFFAKVSTLARECCDHLPCGMPIGKAASGWAGLELLGTAIGPNIRVIKKEEIIDTHLSFNVVEVTLVAILQQKPLKRSDRAIEWWPHAAKITVSESNVIWPFEGVVYDERDDQECTFCGEMERECGGDHADEMRDIGRMEDLYETRYDKRCHT